MLGSRSLLVTGAGGSAGHNVCWSLRVSPDGKNTDLTGTDTDRTGLELNRWLDNAYRIVNPEEPSYVSVLNKIIRRRKVEAVLPQPDHEVERLSRDSGQIEAKLLLPRSSTVSVCLDKYEAQMKWYSARLRKRPIVFSPALGQRLEKVASSLTYPTWLRARQGAGGLLSCLARSSKELYHWIMFHWEHGLKSDFLVEEYLPGRDFCFMSIWKEGTLITSMARERLSWVGNRAVGSGGTSKLNRVVHSEKVNQTAVGSIKAIDENPHGIFCVDLKERVDGSPCPTEVNCRFTTNVHYLTLAAIKLARPELNYAWVAARTALGEEIPKCKQYNAFPANLWFTKNTDMGFTMVEGEDWRAADYQ